MPLKWFRHSPDCSALEDELVPSTMKDATSTHKAKWGKSSTHRLHRSHSQGPGLCALMGLTGSTSHDDLHAAATGATEDDQRRLLYQAKTRRRFTIHGFTSHSKQSDLERRCCSTSLASSSQVPMAKSLDRTQSYSSRGGHGRSPRLLPMNTPRQTAHPSIIFIDCPP
ncbi:unnamed protein product [Hyaloperonospora brassicae]|uniref:RxLR effector candidate protein n=1 Tax=Hyaloperonospora brassicae TaxID=162125 RepID=A0AAV0V4P0_HYABA|nr:unnamed protein product [Hyaloperonospora brassicae]